MSQQCASSTVSVPAVQIFQRLELWILGLGVRLGQSAERLDTPNFRFPEGHQIGCIARNPLEIGPEIYMWLENFLCSRRPDLCEPPLPPKKIAFEKHHSCFAQKLFWGNRIFG